MNSLELKVINHTRGSEVIGKIKDVGVNITSDIETPILPDYEISYIVRRAEEVTLIEVVTLTTSLLSSIADPGDDLEFLTMPSKETGYPAQMLYRGEVSRHEDCIFHGELVHHLVLSQAVGGRLVRPVYAESKDSVF